MIEMDAKQNIKKLLAEEIVQTLQNKGFIAYYAGGCVRDLIMNRDPQDYDIATTAQPEVVEKIFPKTVAVGKQFGVIIVIKDHISFEVATFRKESDYADGRHPNKIHFCGPEEDAKRRDFTMNGIYYDPIQSKIYDFIEGKKDIDKKIIRTIGDSELRFKEDKLRLLRAIRFSSNLAFSIEAKTWSKIKEMASQIMQVSPERIREELVKLFTREHAGHGLELLSGSGLLKVILPEIEAMKGIQQPFEHHPEGDVFVHTKIMMDKLVKPSITLAFGALLHDVGKPTTFSIIRDKIHFYKHAKAGRDIACEILKRFHFSNKDIDSILSCIENHMKFADVKKMRVGKLKQFMSRGTFLEELELHRLDCESSHGMIDNYEFLKQKMEQFKKEDLKPKPLINGDTLIHLGYSAGPLMKVILDSVYEMQLEDKLNIKDEAIKWVLQTFPLKKK